MNSLPSSSGIRQNSVPPNSYEFRYVLVVVVALAGCGDSSSGTSTPRLKQPRLDDAELAQHDDLNLGLEYLNKVYEPGRFYPEPGQPPNSPPSMDRLALYHLNQWLAKEGKLASDWKPTPLLQYLPKSLAAIQPLQELDRMRLTGDDMQFLQGRIWQRDLARRVAQQPLAEPWEAWLKENPGGLSEDDASRLAAALQLFDWTIRNIQLDAFPPAADATTSGTSSDKPDAGALPPQRGVPGPGYQRYPYETLLFGHGDAYERARLFMELCRQREIDSVMLAVAPATGPAKPWAVAVMIGGELYLFDAELGLPLLAAGGRGVVTLAALAKQPELLEQMNVDAKQRYWVKPDDLTSLRPLISASPEELSQRMLWLERAAKGARHLALFVDVDSIVQQLAQMPTLRDAKAGLWRVPFECSLYVSLGLGLRLSRDREFATQYNNETLQLRLPTGLLRQARQLQFLGTFETSEETQSRRRQRNRELKQQGVKGVTLDDREGGAVELLIKNRAEEGAIENLEYSEQWQRQYGIESLPQSPAQRREIFDLVTAQMQRSRDDVTFWLGLVQSEKGDLENAIKWFKLSLPADDSAPEKPWSAAARYNLARCHESLGQTEEAIRFYRADDSPQRYGNRLRAKLLAK